MKLKTLWFCVGWALKQKFPVINIVNSKLATVTEEIQSQWFFFQCPFFPLYQLSRLMKPIFCAIFFFLSLYDG